MKRMTCLAVGIIAGLFLGGIVSEAALTIDWAYGSNLNDSGKGPFSAGWRVQMYRDVNKDSVLSSPTAFNPDGSFVGGTGMADDVLLGSFTTSLATGKSGTNWGLLGIDGSALKGYDVFTVIWDAPSLASASRGIIVDSSPFSFPNQDGYTSYIRSSVAGDWLPVPEPATWTLMGIGAALLGLKRVVRKA
ncbi:MAG: PEP-CTERM sorting domain-containing protein [Kiritimatiellia bacterium]